MPNLTLLTPGQHQLLRAELVDRTTRRLLPWLLEGAHGPEEKTDARADARLLAGRIVDDLLDAVTKDRALASKPTLADLLHAVK